MSKLIIMVSFKIYGSRKITYILYYKGKYAIYVIIIIETIIAIILGLG